jgi:hypothetical protein
MQISRCHVLARLKRAKRDLESFPLTPAIGIISPHRDPPKQSHRNRTGSETISW